MSRLRLWLVVGFVALGVIAQFARVSRGQGVPPLPPPYETYTKVGDKVPAFDVATIDGKRFSTAAYLGKVVVLNLWATWCGPCKEEMPRLQSEVWKGANPNELTVIAIAREETEQQIRTFLKANPYTFPTASDPDRRIFKLFASAGIPRTYVIGRDGRIKYQSLGYVPGDFEQLKAIVKSELARR
jgi:peroxiredoxin